MVRIRPFLLSDAGATHAIFVRAVQIGAATRYSEAERADWLPDATMPEDWGSWLAEHITLVADEGDRLTGFFMLERTGYLNMAYVSPDRMGTGLADRLYAALMDEARLHDITDMTVIASRYAQSFFARHGWTLAPDLTTIPGQPDKDITRALELSRAMRTVLA
jgi:putative acetyltransferase